MRQCLSFMYLWCVGIISAGVWKFDQFQLRHARVLKNCAGMSINYSCLSLSYLSPLPRKNLLESGCLHTAYIIHMVLACVPRITYHYFWGILLYKNTNKLLVAYQICGKSVDMLMLTVTECGWLTMETASKSSTWRYDTHTHTSTPCMLRRHVCMYMFCGW